MALFDELMARAGYVQLAKYGLSLIPDGRIVQAGPRVLPLLDGGSGRRVVGWQAQECPLVAAAPVAAGARVQVAGVVAAHERSGRSSPRGLPPAVIVEDQAEPVPTAEPEDEEWEWQLALARAKIAAAGRADDAPAFGRGDADRDAVGPHPARDRAARAAREDW